MDAIDYWLALNRTPRFGANRFRALLELGIAPQELFSEITSHTRAGQALSQQLSLSTQTLQFIRSPDWQGVERDRHWQQSQRHHFILHYAEPGYPPLLKEIADPPMVIFGEGDPQTLLYPQLAIVGSRNPSAPGKRAAFEFSRHLSNAGLIITSGMALGIDAQAHTGALAGNGISIAVTGSGPGCIYPSSHKKLCSDIQEQGAVISELLPGQKPLPHHFPRRNRLISGLSLGTLVVEAAAKSGSLITARLAAEQGREVFTLPGSINNPLARGCHALIRQGAALVESAEEILQALLPKIRKPGIQSIDAPRKAQETSEEPLPRPSTQLKLQPLQQQVMDLLGFEPGTIDILVEQSSMSAETISSVLVELELLGLVHCLGGVYSCKLGDFAAPP